MDLKQNIKYLKGVGEKRAQLLEKLGVFCVGDLIEHYPRRYEDHTIITEISDCNAEEYYTIKARIITPIIEHRIKQGMELYKFQITDDSDVISVTLFNQKYTAKALKEDTEYIFHGKVGANLLQKQMTSPEIDVVNKTHIGGGIKSIYNKTTNISDKILSRLIKTAIENLADNQILEYLPNNVIERYELISIKKAIYDIHFPRNLEEMAIAKKRLVFDELLKLSLSLYALKRRNRGYTSNMLTSVKLDEFVELLPYELTTAQKKAINEATSDMKKSVPMSRLVQGDVGSGKTIIAGALIYLTYKNHMQSCLMAPTEILASQHYNTLSPLLEKLNVAVALVTKSTPKKQKLLISQKLAIGEIDLLIGTHAIIEDYIKFKNLALIITDEQHRFGVNQRAKLASKSHNPHTLVMSATPIPRTLALFIYGDLDISVVDELPKGRISIKTYLVNDKKRNQIYDFIKQGAKNGVQSFVVCPLVEQDDTNELKSVEAFYNDLKIKYFPDIEIDFIHGKLKSKQKQEVMERFCTAKSMVLVATTVIEVGVDVPNANIMIIENAERFGLSQLHQLRGRIGRGNTQAHCFLLSNSNSSKTMQRLNILKNSNNGFEISNEDLKLRGPGDFFGFMQHGELALKIADLSTDNIVLAQVKEIASQIIKQDSSLALPEHKFLKEKIETTLHTGKISIFN